MDTHDDFVARVFASHSFDIVIQMENFHLRVESIVNCKNVVISFIYLSFVGVCVLCIAGFMKLEQLIHVHTHSTNPSSKLKLKTDYVSYLEVDSCSGSDG